MDRNEKIVIPVLPQIKAPQRKERVAAYARVSSGKDTMLHSLSAQVSYYSELIQANPAWEYCGVYADEDFTGTKDSRPEFQRLLTDCRAGKIDRVITKSISRFARNTVTLLNTVRELKGLGIDCYFDEQNIHSLSADGELILTLLASYAQEESLSVSENCKWRIRNKYKDGIPNYTRLYGYRMQNGKLIIDEKEAEIVREIFASYLLGMGFLSIAKMLRERGVKGLRGKPFSDYGISYILRNEKYAGDLVLQKSFVKDHLSKRKQRNHGELPRYYIPDNHPPIIDLPTFERVQREIVRRNDRVAERNPRGTYLFSGMIVCENCGKHYRRKTTHGKHAWQCTTFLQFGKAACAAKQVPETTLIASIAQVLGLDVFDEELFKRQIKEIRVPGDNRLVFCFQSGQEKEVTWADRSRRDSWTPEMRQRASTQMKERNRK